MSADTTSPGTDLPRIGVVIGSIRDGRKGEAVARWVLAGAQQRDDAAYELIDLRALDVPLLTSATVPGAARKVYADERVTAWSRAVDACDGFVFVTPEYNHGVPGAFKNAFDSLGTEWSLKAVGFVSYGADGGVRAVESWRVVIANFHMVGVRGVVSLSTFSDFDGAAFTPAERRTGERTAMLDQLVAATLRQRAART